MKYTPSFIFLLASILFWGSCSDLDDTALPPDAKTHIYFQAFEVNARRNFVLGKLINNSPYTLTSCRFRIDIYTLSPDSQTPLSLTELEAGTEVMPHQVPVLTKDFLVREALKPGYSTEVYFELRLKDLKGPAVYSQTILELKGQVST